MHRIVTAAAALVLAVSGLTASAALAADAASDAATDVAVVVVADLDGVVVVPQARIAAVLARLPQIRAAEARADAAVRDGARLPSFLAVDTASAAPKP